MENPARIAAAIHQREPIHPATSPRTMPTSIMRKNAASEWCQGQTMGQYGSGSVMQAQYRDAMTTLVMPQILAALFIQQSMWNCPLLLLQTSVQRQLRPNRDHDLFSPRLVPGLLHAKDM